MEKMTYTGALTAVLSTVEMSAEVREKLEALRAQLEKRATYKSTKPSKASVEAAAFVEGVRIMLEKATEPMTCGALAKVLGVSGQKTSAALRKLVEAGEVTKTMEKRVAYFSVAQAE